VTSNAFVCAIISRVAIINTVQTGIGRCDVTYSICRFVCLCLAYCGKTAEWTWMPFRVVSRLGPRMRQVDRGCNRPTGRGNFVGGYGTPHCNQWGICGVVVWKCVKRSSCRLEWWMGSGERGVY